MCMCKFVHMTLWCVYVCVYVCVCVCECVYDVVGM